MTATKTNERPGTRAVLPLLRDVGLQGPPGPRPDPRRRTSTAPPRSSTGTEREAAEIIGKVLTSAVANAAHNDQQNPEELYVSACYADEGTTMKRWRPRARGRATRIRKRTCHITIIVSRLPADQLELRRRRMEAVSANRSRRVDASRRRADLSGRLSRRRAAQAAAAEQAAAEAAAAEEAERGRHRPGAGRGRGGRRGARGDRGRRRWTAASTRTPSRTRRPTTESAEADADEKMRTSRWARR